MAYFFNNPDFYNMRKDRLGETNRLIDNFMQTGPHLDFARYQQAKSAIESEKARNAELGEPTSNLAAQNIASGFINSIGTKDGAALQNAIQATENAGNARVQESLNRRERVERDRATQAMQQQQAKYAEEVNARMQLLQKSNEIANSIKDLATGEIMNQNPEFAKKKINDLILQKNGIDAQLKQATEAVRNNPIYQGTTLVEPVDVSRWKTEDATSAQGITNSETPSARVNNFLLKEFKGLGRQQINAKISGDSWNKFISENPTIEMSKKDFESAFDNAKKEHLGIRKGRQEIELEDKKYNNEKLKLAAENLNNRYDLAAIEQKAKTQDQFVNNLGEGVLRNLAVQNGLQGSDWKAFGNAIFNHFRSKRKTQSDEDLLR